MIKSYIPPKITTLTVFVCIVLWLLNFTYTSYLILFVYFALYAVLRRRTNNFLDDPMITKGVIFSPTNGKIINIEPNISHPVFGEQFTEIQIMLPWWKEYGIYLPFSSEIKNLQKMKGKSFFRLSKFEKVIGSKEGRGLNLKLDNRGEVVGLSLYKCLFGLWPEIIVMPGDRGSRRVNIGFFPFGGTVMLYLPKNYEILLQTNDEVTAGESILAVHQENK